MAVRHVDHAYLRRREAIEELPTALEWVKRGDCFVSHRVSQALLRRIVRGIRPSRSGDAAQLTERQFEVYERLGRGLGPKVIAQELKLSVKTVETYQQQLKEKFGLHSAEDLRTRARHWLTTHSKRPQA